MSGKGESGRTMGEEEGMVSTSQSSPLSPPPQSLSNQGNAPQSPVPPRDVMNEDCEGSME